jgi:hypothetical protein
MLLGGTSSRRSARSCSTRADVTGSLAASSGVVVIAGVLVAERPALAGRPIEAS